MRAAIVNDTTGIVENVVILGGENWAPPAGHSVIPEPGPGAEPGAVYDPVNGTFTAATDVG